MAQVDIRQISLDAVTLAVKALVFGDAVMRFDLRARTRCLRNLILFHLTLPQSYAGTTTVFVDEFDTGQLKRPFQHCKCRLPGLCRATLELPNRSDAKTGSVRELLLCPVEEASRCSALRSVGGCDACVIMGNSETALLRLWQEKCGEIELEDLSGNLIVQLGTVTEELNRRWYQANTGLLASALVKVLRAARLKG